MVPAMINGRPLALRWAAQNVPAILEAWLPGELGGQAVAEMLFGRHSPSGRLPVTFPRHAGQLPVYYDHNPPRRSVSGAPAMSTFRPVRCGSSATV